MAAPKNDNVKAAILNAAERLLSRQPDVSLADIAKEAQISKGTLFYHYRSKTDIILDISERYWSQLSDALLAWVDDPNKITTPVRLARYVMQRGVFDKSGPLRLHLFVDAISNDRADSASAVRNALIEQYTHFKNILKTRILERNPGAAGEELAWLLLLMVDGLTVQHSLQNTEIDIDRYIEWLAGQFPESV